MSDTLTMNTVYAACLLSGRFVSTGIEDQKVEVVRTS